LRFLRIFDNFRGSLIFQEYLLSKFYGIFEKFRVLTEFQDFLEDLRVFTTFGEFLGFLVKLVEFLDFFGVVGIRC
jgi:hypothetical protein